jgi:O-antigen ligase
VRRQEPTLHAWPLAQAHHDYLGLGAEMGTLGLLLVVGGLGWCGWQTLRRWSRRHTPELRTAAALEPASAAMLLHALWDRTHDRELLGAVARGTPEDARWREAGP